MMNGNRAAGWSRSSNSGSPLLSVRELRTWFRTGRGVVHALDGVSFDLDTGETLGVVGESGSGKSVLARSVMRLLPPEARTAGDVIFDGANIAVLPRERVRHLWGNEISMVFQNPMTSMNPVMRVGRQIAEVIEVHRGGSAAEIRDRCVELLRMVGIPEAERRLRSYPHEMSGGMRQRACIAMAIACEPRLLVADEPTTALDVTIQRQILDGLDSLRERSQMALMLISHDLGVVAGRTDRVIVMYGGQIVECGVTIEIFERPRHPYTAALLAAIPRVEDPSHQRLAALTGRPVDVVDPSPGCRFAQRCVRAQSICVNEDPPLVPEAGRGDHLSACFFPLDEPSLPKRLVSVGVSAPAVRAAAPTDGLN